MATGYNMSSNWTTTNATTNSDSVSLRGGPRDGELCNSQTYYISVNKMRAKPPLAIKLLAREFIQVLVAEDSIYWKTGTNQYTWVEDKDTEFEVRCLIACGNNASYYSDVFLKMLDDIQKELDEYANVPKQSLFALDSLPKLSYKGICK